MSTLPSALPTPPNALLRFVCPPKRTRHREDYMLSTRPSNHDPEGRTRKCSRENRCRELEHYICCQTWYNSIGKINALRPSLPNSRKKIKKSMPSTTNRKSNILPANQDLVRTLFLLQVVTSVSSICALPLSRSRMNHALFNPSYSTCLITLYVVDNC